MPIQTMARYAKWAGLVATLLTIGITARFGWLQGEDAVTSICYAGGLALASFLVGYGLVFAWASHRAGLHWLITTAAVVVFAIAVAVEMLSHLGATASARNHDMAKASEATNSYTDTRAEIARKEAELAAQKAPRVATAISADMAGLEQRPWFANTQGCTAPGAYGNSCRRYQALKSELAVSQRYAALEREIRDLKARSAASTAGHSVAAAQTSALAQYATLSIRPSEDDKARTNMGIQLLLALYFVAIGLVNLIAHALDAETVSASAEAARPTATVIVPEFRPAATQVMVGRAVLPKVAA